MNPVSAGVDFVYWGKLLGEALLAGIVAFGTVYGASADLKSSLIAGAIAAITKACPSSVTTAVSGAVAGK